MSTIKTITDYLEEAEDLLKNEPGFLSPNKLGIHYLKQAMILIKKGYPNDYDLTEIIHRNEYFDSSLEDLPTYKEAIQMGFIEDYVLEMQKDKHSK